MNDIKLKLIIDGKEAAAAIQLTETEIDKLQVKLGKSNPMLAEFQKHLLSAAGTNDEAVQSISEFIRYNELSENQVRQVISSLTEGQRTLGITSEEYRQHSSAISGLNSALGSLSAGQDKGQQSSNAMTAAVVQAGSALGDASMFLVDFKTGLKGLADNLPTLISLFSNAKTEAASMGTTVGKQLVSSLTGVGGLSLALNAVALVLDLLPALFKDTTEEVKKQKEEIEKLTKEYEKLASSEIKSLLGDLEKQLNKFESKYPIQTKSIPSFNLQRVFGGMSPFYFEQVKDKDRFGDDADEVIKLKEKISLLKMELQYKGIIDDAEIRLEANRAKYKNLNQKNFSLIVYGAKSYNEAKETLDQWIEADEKILSKSNSKDKKDTYEEKLSDAMSYHDERIKLDNSYLPKYKKFLDEQLDYYEDFINKKGGYDYLSIEELALINKLHDRKNELSRISASDVKAESTDSDKEDLDDIKAASSDSLIAKITSKEKNEYDELKEVKINNELEYEQIVKDVETDLHELRMNNINSLVNAYSEAANSIYSYFEQSTTNEIDLWRDKEEKKLDEEHKAALKHARTQKQRERIDEEYQKSKDRLDDEANEKAKEKLLFWFRMQQLASIAQATVNTYEGATKALAQGGVIGPILAGLVIAAGLANVATISAQKFPAYALGGRLPEGQPGFIEGWHNELIAPEKTFENIMRTELIPRVINNVTAASDPALIEEIRAMRSDLRNLKAKAYLDNHQARKVVLAGMGQSRRESL